MNRQLMFQLFFFLITLVSAASEASYLQLGVDQTPEVLEIASLHDGEILHSESVAYGALNLRNPSSLHLGGAAVSIYDANARFLPDRTVLFTGSIDFNSYSSTFGMLLSIQAVEDPVVLGTTNTFRIRTLRGVICAFPTPACVSNEWGFIDESNHFAQYYISLTGDVEFLGRISLDDQEFPVAVPLGGTLFYMFTTLFTFFGWRLRQIFGSQ